MVECLVCSSCSAVVEVSYSHFGEDFDGTKFFFSGLFMFVVHLGFRYVIGNGETDGGGLWRYGMNGGRRQVLTCTFMLFLRRWLDMGRCTAHIRLLLNLLILLTENTPGHSGCQALYRVLQRIAPTLGLLTYRRGPTVYAMPVPLWPARRHFLAARFLIGGARRRQRVDRTSFLLALYGEVMDVLEQKYDSFTLKLSRHYQNRILRAEPQVWRVRKRLF